MDNNDSDRFFLSSLFTLSLSFVMQWCAIFSYHCRRNFVFIFEIDRNIWERRTIISITFKPEEIEITTDGRTELRPIQNKSIMNSLRI